jgi:hypothetical protein
MISEEAANTNCIVFGLTSFQCGEIVWKPTSELFQIIS